jgi:PAS domain S-box-containing protein
MTLPHSDSLLSLDVCQHYALQLLAAVPDAVIVTTSSGLIKTVNPAAQVLFEWAEPELIGQPIQQVIPESDLLPQDGYIPSEARFQRTMEVNCRTRSSETVQVSLSRSTLVSEQAELQGYLYIGQDVTARKQADRKLRAEHAIARIFAEANSLQSATPKILQTICETLDWDLGELWTVDPQIKQLRCVETWLLPSLHIPEFDHYTQQIQIPAGVGLPGKVWQTGQPLWMSDVTQDESFLRAAPAAHAGLHAAVGFPVFNGTETLGVIVFFSRTIQPPNPQLLSMMSAIASQIGQFVRRRQTEEVLVEMRECFQSIFDSTDLGVAITTLEGHCLKFNPALSSLLGYTPEKLLGKAIREFIHPDDQDTDWELMQQLIAGTIPRYQLEKRLLSKNGTELRGWLTVSLIRNAQAEAIARVVQIQDITAHKQAETDLANQTVELDRCHAELYQQTNILQSVLEGVTDGVVVVDEQGEFLAFNPAAQSIYGTSAVEIEPKQWVEPQQLLSPQQPNAAPYPSGKLLLLRAMRGETADGVEVYVHRRNQQDGIWVNTTARPLRNEAGTVQGGVLIIRNVSDRKQAESALEHQFRRSLLLKQLTQDIRQNLNIQQILQTAIAQLSQVFRVSRGMIYACLNTENETTLFPQLGTAFLQPICVAEALESGYSSIRDLEISWSGNPYLEQVLVQDEAIAVPNVYAVSQLQGLEPFYQQIGLKSMLAVRTAYNGEINGIICLHQCDTFRSWNADEIELLETVAAQIGIALNHAHLLQHTTQQQQQLDELNTALAVSQQSVDAATQSTHEYLTLIDRQICPLLHSVLDLTQQLQQSPLNFQQQTAVELICVHHNAALTRVNEILDFSKIEAGTLVLEHQPFNLLTCVEDCLDRLVPKALTKGLSLVSLIPPEVPELVSGDRTRLQQILATLLEQFLLLTESREVRIRVTAQPMQSETDSLLYYDIYFAVQGMDIGIVGVGEASSLGDRVPHLFYPFSQIDFVHPNFPNIALGLALSQRLARQMGGDLWFEKEPEQTLSFHVSIHLPLESQETSTSSQTATLSGKRLLIVESSPTVRESLSLQAQRWGLVVRAVPSATQALNQLHYERFDGVLLEWQSVDAKGRSLINQIRQQPDYARLPLIELLPMGVEIDAAIVDTAMSLSKPIRHVDFYRVLTQALCSPFA